MKKDHHTISSKTMQMNMFQPQITNDIKNPERSGSVQYLKIKKIKYGGTIDEKR
jgi:hypothetical protein